MLSINHLLGAHISGGGYLKALEKITKLGGNCLQIFSSSPLTWGSAVVEQSTIENFRKQKDNLKILRVYFHALYLVNLADSGQTGEKSVRALIDELNLSAKLNINGSIIHTGSFKNKTSGASCRAEKNYPILLENIKTILKNTPKESLLILENSGTRKIGQTIDQLAEILADINNDRIRVCLDTCHLHASGYDLKDEKQFLRFLEDFDSKIGIDKIEVIHLNDSRDDFNSLRDRHENIGAGFVGVDVFKNFLNHKKTHHLPFILEVPGFDGNGPDEKNFTIVKSLIS